MSRLAEHGVCTLVWSEDEEGNVFAEGLQSYEIDADNELAIFQDDKCVKVQKCADLYHAVSMVYSGEAVCRWYMKNGGDGRGHKVNEKGWVIK